MPSRSADGCSTRTTLHLVGSHNWTAVPAVLRYEVVEPFAVRIRFGAGPDDAAASAAARDTEEVAAEPGASAAVEWLLSRDLLRAGTSRPAGEGDVRLWPGRGNTDALFLQLRAPSGEALFEMSLAVVTAFLADTERLVPRGSETLLLGVDEALEALLQGDGTDPGTR